MSAKRKFDYDEAARLRAEGLSYEKIGQRLGVSGNRVNQVLNPEVGRRVAERSAAFQQSGVCPECGGPATRQAGGRQHRCSDCAYKAQATSVRETELQCVNCGEWKPDEDFPRSRAVSPHRRGRHKACRLCATVLRRDYRARNRERERAYDREYRRRVRAAL